MRKVTRTGSKRSLTSKRLTVDWWGYGTVFYWITKTQMKEVFAGAKKILIQGREEYNTFSETMNKDYLTFNIVRRSDGSINIGCERFVPKEVKELRKWCKQ